MKKQGFVIVGKRGSILHNYFRALKRDCIEDFVDDGYYISWKQLKKEYGWKCVKATQTIEINE